KITNVAWRGRERLMTYAPFDLGEFSLSAAHQLDLCFAKEWHREIARHPDLILLVFHVNWKSFDEVFPAVAIIERARPEKERDWRFDGWLRALVPGDAQHRPGEGYGLIRGHGEFQGSNHCWGCCERGECYDAAFCQTDAATERR